MTDAEKLFLWISGKRSLSISEQLEFCNKGFCRMRTEASCTSVTPEGHRELSKPRRRFRPRGSKPTIGEVLTAALGGVIAFSAELNSTLGNSVTTFATIEILEMTTLGRSTMLTEFPVKEIRGIYGSELII